MRALLLLLSLATPAWAQDAVTADEFQSLVEGRTLTYGASGQPPYGIEHYFPNRRVTWAFLGSDECLEGTWHAEGPPDAPAICFEYQDGLGPQCWRFTQDGDSLQAEFLGEGGGLTLYELKDDDGGLVCGGVGA